MSSDSDPEAPEAISFPSSRKNSKVRAKAIRDHEIKERASKKNKNRARDKLLKEKKAKRAEMYGAKELNRKGRQTAPERMKRAMNEDDMADGDDDEGDDDGLDDEMDQDDLDGEGDEWGGISNKVAADLDTTSKQLPEHVFAAAAVNKAATNPPSFGRISKHEKKEEKKKNRKANRAKELIIGDRAIKVLSSDSPMVGERQPPPQINRFIEKQLQLHDQEITVATTPSLAKRRKAAGRQRKTGKDDSTTKSKGGPSQSKNWNRMPVNLGVMKKSNGPAKNFVRAATSTSTSRP